MPRSANPVPQYFDSDNKILSGGKVFYFNAGTSTPKVTYSDEAETIANPDPVVLDAAGRLPNVFFTGTAKQILKDSNNVQIWERDNVGSTEQISDFNSYDENISYDAGDIVKFNGMFYISLQNTNQNNQPDSSLTFWSEIRFIEVYNTNVDYGLGVIVQTSDGNLWKSVNTPNQGNDPSVDDGTNWAISINETKFNAITTDTLTVVNTSTLNDVAAQDIDSVLLKRAASTVYARDDILGNVTEAAGVPTGAIIETGSNGNGDFVKYANGTLICHDANGNCFIGGSTITFPHAFVDNTKTVVMVTSRGSQDLITSNGNTLTTFNVFSIVSSTGASSNVVFNFIAIGRWF